MGPTALLCPTCHRQLHALFSETTLAQELHSIELLRANEQVTQLPAVDAEAEGRGEFSGAAGEPAAVKRSEKAGLDTG